MKKRQKRRKNNKNYFVGLTFIIFFLLIATGNATLNSNIKLAGNLKIGANLEEYNISLKTKDVTVNGDDLMVKYGFYKEIELEPTVGTIIYSAFCTNNYTIEGLITGIQSYSSKQKIKVNNNNTKSGTLCTILARNINSYEVSYSYKGHDFVTAEDAINYLYEAMKIEIVTPEEIIYYAYLVGYEHKMHPEFTNVEDALNYIYEAIEKEQINPSHVVYYANQVAYLHINHPEISNTKEALDYIYSKLYN